MPGKLMAFDLDGTLIFDQKISSESADAIREWQEAGNLAVCATGKSLASARKAVEGYGIRFDYYVLYTGAVVADAEQNVLTSSTLPNGLVQDVVNKLAAEPDVAVYGTTLDTDDVRFYSNIPDKTTEILPHFQAMDPEEIPEHEFVGVPIWVDDESKIAGLQEFITSTYGDVVDCHRNQMFLDIVPSCCTKASGLVWLDEQHLGGRYLPYSIGDSWNDLPMHAWAKHSASFAHSPLEVQEATETVTTSAADYIREVLAEEASASDDAPRPGAAAPAGVTASSESEPDAVKPARPE